MPSFLDRLPAELSDRVRASAFERSLEAGEVLVREGDHGRSLFLVVQGTIEARTGDQVVNVCEPGDVIGEVAFLDGDARSADLVAPDTATVLVWPYDKMHRLTEQHPEIQVSLLRSIAMRSVRSVRRMTAATQPAAPPARVPLEVGDFVPGEPQFHRHDGGVVRLTKNECKLLDYLVARPGRPNAYETLLEEVFGYKKDTSSRTVYATVHRLRGKVERDPKSPRHIVSLPGGGYRFDPLTPSP